jgi:peroxiredoxin
VLETRNKPYTTPLATSKKKSTMKKILLGIIALLIISCNGGNEKEFSFKGTIKGIENGTVLYLDYDNKVLDSTKVENNSFTFNTKLPSYPLQLWLHTKNFSNYRAFWAENKPMSFLATETDFKKAKITGSEIEKLSQTLYQSTDSLSREERVKKEMEFVKEHPNSIVSAHILSVYATTWGKEKTSELFGQFSTKNKKSDFGQQIGRYIELNKEPKIGNQFVDFKMEDQNGNIKTFSDIKGKVVLLEFWASWCGPCRKENPNLVKTYEKFHPKGFEIFAVSLDEDKENWLKAIEKDSLNWTQVSDLKGQGNEASLIYGINGIPDNFLISENGEIIGRYLRGEKLNQKLDEILN